MPVAPVHRTLPPCSTGALPPSLQMADTTISAASQPPVSPLTSAARRFEPLAIPGGPAGPASPGAPAGPGSPRSPLSPLEPAIPVGPGSPRSPLSPFSPFAPAGPAGPFSPRWPATPCGPAGPCRPASPCGPAGPSRPCRPLRTGRPLRAGRALWTCRAGWPLRPFEASRQQEWCSQRNRECQNSHGVSCVLCASSLQAVQCPINASFSQRHRKSPWRPGRARPWRDRVPRPALCPCEFRRRGNVAPPRPCVSKPRDFRGVPRVSRALPGNSKSHLNFKGLRRPSATAPSLRNCPTRAIDVAGEESIVSGMAGRYATALFELALEEQRARRGARPISTASTRCSPRAPICARLVRSPVFTADEQTQGADRRARQGRHRRARRAISSRWWRRTAGCSRCAT